MPSQLTTTEAITQYSKVSHDRWPNIERLLTILDWIGFDIYWPADPLSFEAPIFQKSFWVYQLKWFVELLEIRQELSKEARIKVPIVYPPIDHDHMADVIQRYRAAEKESSFFYRLFEKWMTSKSGRLPKHLHIKLRRSQSVLEFEDWSRLFDILQMLTLVELPAGTFKRGYSSWGPDHSVKIEGQRFVMCFPITELVWDWIMNSNTSSGPRSFGPKTRISWTEACYFCNKLSIKFGLEQVYEGVDIHSLFFNQNILDLVDPFSGYNTQIDSESVYWSRKGGFRLLTEAEWDYMSYCGEPWSAVGFESFSKVKEIPPKSSLGIDVQLWPLNKWGVAVTPLSILEWCWDGYEAHYWKGFEQGSEILTPLGPNRITQLKVCSGSAYCDKAEFYLSERKIFRRAEHFQVKSKDLGFRLILDG
jgi:hypothetical protein